MTKTFIFLIEMSFRCLFWSVAKDKRNRELILLRKENQILKRKLPKPQFTNSDRLFYICLFKYAKEIVKKVSLIKPETILRWHKNRCQKKWTYPSRSVGRHPVDENIRSIVIEMKQAIRDGDRKEFQGSFGRLAFHFVKRQLQKY